MLLASRDATPVSMKATGENRRVTLGVRGERNCDWENQGKLLEKVASEGGLAGWICFDRERQREEH